MYNWSFSVRLPTSAGSIQNPPRFMETALLTYIQNTAATASEPGKPSTRGNSGHPVWRRNLQLPLHTRSLFCRSHQRPLCRPRSPCTTAAPRGRCGSLAPHHGSEGSTSSSGESPGRGPAYLISTSGQSGSNARRWSLRSHDTRRSWATNAPPAARGRISLLSSSS